MGFINPLITGGHHPVEPVVWFLRIPPHFYLWNTWRRSPRIHYGKRCSTHFFFTKFSKKPAASSQQLDQTLPWDHSPETCAEGESHWITYADSSIWRDENFCIQEWIQKGIPGYPKVPLLLLRYPWSFHRITWDMASIAPIQFFPMIYPENVPMFVG